MYKTINVDGKRVLEHRYVWEQHYGQILHGYYIDHINGDKLDNRIENLRLATPFENAQNRKLSKNNTTGVKGVSICSQTGDYLARKTIEGRRHFIGRFKTLEEAEIAMKPYNENKFEDVVNRPSHYMLCGIEVKDIMEAISNSGLCDHMTPYESYCFFNVIKYRMRAGKKGDKALEDLAKSATYERMIK